MTGTVSRVRAKLSRSPPAMSLEQHRVTSGNHCPPQGSQAEGGQCRGLGEAGLHGDRGVTLRAERQGWTPHPLAAAQLSRVPVKLKN